MGEAQELADTTPGVVPSISGLARGVDRLCLGLCIAGGLVLVAALTVTMLNILARLCASLDIGISPFTGDGELMEAACAIAIFAFLPWCQLNNGHVTVDLFVSRLGMRAGLFISLLSDLGMAAAASFIAWRLVVNMLEKYQYGETTMLLQLPIWQIYLAASVGSVCFVLACCVTFGRNFAALARAMSRTRDGLCA